MLETFLAGPWCCQCDPALPWCSWTVRFTRDRVSFVDVELPLDVRLVPQPHTSFLLSCLDDTHYLLHDIQSVVQGYILAHCLS